MLSKKKLGFFFIALLCLLMAANYFLDNKISLFLKKTNVLTLNALQENFSPFWQFVNDFKKLSNYEIKNEIAYLRNENFLLKNQINDLKIYEKENQELKELLTLKTNSQQDHIFSKIISYDPQNQFLSLVVDKGEAAGVKSGSPVIAFQKEQRFLVGFVLLAGEETSLIQTLFHKDTQIAVTIGGSQAKGILRGKNYFQESLVIEFIDINLTNLINQPVFTSGLGQKYPADILIGKSTKTIKKNYGLFQQVEVLPYSDFFKIKYVLILKK